MIAIPAAMYRSAPGPGPESVHGVLFEQFRAPASECPKECFFWHFWAPKNTKKHSKGLFAALRDRCPKLLKKHSVGRFQAWAPGHSCKWQPGAQQYEMILRRVLEHLAQTLPQRFHRGFHKRGAFMRALWSDRHNCL